MDKWISLVRVNLRIYHKLQTAPTVSLQARRCVISDEEL